jgi:tRNA A-37 threonylcarbamoyl transferase component Bud32
MAGFAFPSFTGQIADGFAVADLERQLELLVDPAAALKTLHWGRNYLYLTRCDTAAGPMDVVVKQFRNRHLRDRLRRRFQGSKAEKSWRIARAMAAAGIPSPEALLLIESTCATGPSFYVCRYVPDAIEARYVLRAANADRMGELYPDLDLPAFLHRLGAFIRRLHDAGFWHRDLSSGNVLLRGDELWLVDLNRTRAGLRLSVSQRARDLSRMNLLRREHRQLFLAGYWQTEGGPPAPALALYLGYFNAFLLKNRLKKRLRGNRPASPSGLGRVAHAHIPEAPAGAAMRDLAVWDRLSDQPHQHAGTLSKARVRLADASIHAVTAATVVRSLPRIWKRYRALPRSLHGGAVPWAGAGLCVRPWPAAPDTLLALIDELATPHLLLRLHPWEDDHTEEEALAAELSRRGYELTFALPQNRDLVRDPARWRASLAHLGKRFSPYGRRFQVGQAINRSKWGVWNLREYAELARGAEETLRRYPGVELLGPSVIDFEYHLTIAVLNMAHAGFRFDAVTSLLYVDRRGAPENRQVGFDTVDKVRLLRAIADTGANGSGRCWITEVNWPLWEGPHSPAGRTVAVSEETQADYLVRYFLLTLGTGLVERVFWWQLVARGYGLVDPSDPAGPRRRASFTAFATLLRELAGCRLEELLPAPPAAHLYRFRRPAAAAAGGEANEGDDVVVGWSATEARTPARLPRPAARAVSRDGTPLAAPPGRDVELLPSPVYYHLAAE